MTTKVQCSIVVPVRNEAAGIAAFLAAHSWADEIVVVDNGSTDDTATIAVAHGATLLAHPDGTIADARNVGAAAAKHDWILALDADELADATLADEVAGQIASGTHGSYRIRRRNMYLGREQRRGRWGRDWVIRLYRMPKLFTQRKVHEELLAEGDVGTLNATLLHHTYRDLSHHLSKMDRYARWGAEELYARGKRATPFDIFFRPRWRFFKAYILNGHCLDGTFGLVTSQLGAQTAFLKYAHLWALERERASQQDR